MATDPNEQVISEELKYLRVARSDVNDHLLQADWTKKRLTWVPHETQGFVLASIKEEKGDELVVEILETGKRQVFSKDDVQRPNPPKYDKVEDMAELTCLNEASVLNNLKGRYYSNLIYTYSGLFCVVINPYQRLPIYSERLVELYKGKKRNDLPPHVFAVTDSAYRSMLQEREDQSILCTGESGAGKTENTKKVIQYLAHVASATRPGKSAPPHTPTTPTRGELELQLLQANPILEAFGNAKTVKNDNSSRFGKFIRINFDTSGFISGANIESYLLEKSRANRQAKDERGFHVFYQLLQGATLEEKKAFYLEDIKKYRFMSNGYIPLPGVDDVQEFHNTIRAMKIMNFDDEEVHSILRVVSAVLHFGNMEFVQEKKSDQALLPDDTIAQKVCRLIGVPVTELSKALLRPRIKVGRDYVHKAQNKEQAEFSVEAISKACYERMFKWLVNRINKSLDRTKRQGVFFIGILDMAGFEIFNLNSFEQLCINYTNEKLQQLFNHTMFVLEQEEYQREGIEWQFIDFGLDLQPTIDLIEKPMGILSLMDDECLFPKATDKSFVEKLKLNHAQHPKFIVPDFKAASNFAVMHYAGRVDYLADQWLMKNMDPLNENVVQLLQNSSDPFVVNIWKDAEFAGIGSTEMNETAFGMRAKKGMFRTVGQLYKEQLTRLMQSLRNTEPHFVRCIIPNYEKKSGKITPMLVLEQLRCNGVLEGIRICRQGFPSRVLFQEFRQRYEILTPNIIPKGFMDGKEAAKKIIAALEMDSNLFRIGQSKIFFRAGVLAHLEEERDLKLTDLIVNFQAVCRGFLARKMYQKRMQQFNAIRVIQRNGLSYLKLRNWQWWRLFTKVKPVLPVTNHEQTIRLKEDELRGVKEQLQRFETDSKDYEKRYQQITEERAVLSEQLQAESEAFAEAEEARDRLLLKKKELEGHVQELEARLDDEHEAMSKMVDERKRLQQNVQDLEEQLQEEENVRQKLQMEKIQFDKEVKALKESRDFIDSNLTKITKDKKLLEEQNVDLMAKLTEEEEKNKHLLKLKAKYEAQIAELEEQLAKERQIRQELEKVKRKLETELGDLKDQLNDKRAQLEEYQQQLIRRDEQIAVALNKCEEESAAKAELVKRFRELDTQVKDLQDDLEAEKQARAKAERQKRDQQEEIEALRAEMEERDDVTHVHAEMRAKREEELNKLKKTMDEELANRDSLTVEMRQKHARQVDELNVELDLSKKQRTQTEKLKTSLEQEVVELQNELRAVQSARAESERKRKILEQQLQDTLAKSSEAEKARGDASNVVLKIQTELETSSKQLEETEQKFGLANKQLQSLQQQVSELQDSLQEETRAKLNLQSKLRQHESDQAALKEQNDDFEETKAALEKQISILQQQVTELKKKCDEVPVEVLEELRKKTTKDLEMMQKKIQDVEASRDRSERSKKKMQQEIDDMIVELDNLRASNRTMEVKQRKFDQHLTEERTKAAQALQDRDVAAQEARDRDSKLLSLQKEFEELHIRYDDCEKNRTFLKLELDDLMSSTDKSGKSYNTLKAEKMELEKKVNDQQAEIEELEDALQLAESARSRLEITSQAQRTEAEKSLQQKENEAKEKRATLLKQISDLEKELDNERRKQLGSIDVKRKLESQVQELEQQLDLSNRAFRKLEKRYGSTAVLIEDERRISEQCKGELDRATGKNKTLKRQVEELEEETARLNAKVRKCNRELEDLTEQNENLQKEMQLLRTRTKSYRIDSRTTRAYIATRSVVGSEWNRGSSDALNMTDGSAGSRDGSIADESAPPQTNGDDRKSFDGLP